MSRCLPLIFQFANDIRILDTYIYCSVRMSQMMDQKFRTEGEKLNGSKEKQKRCKIVHSSSFIFALKKHKQHKRKQDIKSFFFNVPNYISKYKVGFRIISMIRAMLLVSSESILKYSKGPVALIF